jgi:hypothetical protein
MMPPERTPDQPGDEVFMDVLWIAVSAGFTAVVLWEVFETMVVPRRVTRAFRLTRLFYRTAWTVWSALAQCFRAGRWRVTFLSVFGPLSLLGLFVTWATTLVIGFGLLQWALRTPLRGDAPLPLSVYLYLSGSTFFTLGYGDFAPESGIGRFLAVVEAGVGFGFIALVISYLPVLYQAFSRREVTISLLDARAGSPPSAAQLLLRLQWSQESGALTAMLSEWEHWTAELLESHLSYPVLSFYRSQHDNQSWLAALTTVLDTCALVLAGVHMGSAYQAQLTFAMARHAVVDLALVFHTPPLPLSQDRLAPDRLAQLRADLRLAGAEVRDGSAADTKLAGLRELYEPFVNALGRYFLLTLPPVVPESTGTDNWQTTAWTRRSPGFERLSAELRPDDHFD